MAGIGLRLRELVVGQTYLNGAVAYFSSAVISAGPWLISVLSLTLLSGRVAAFLSPDDHALLFATIVYAFVSSLILTAPVQIILLRIVADHIFLDDVEGIAPAFLHTFVHSCIFLTLLIVPFILLAPFELSYRLFAGSLFLTVSLIWLILAPLSAAKDYLGIVFAFVIGYSISAGATVWLGQRYGLPGAIVGFAFGQVVCLVFLIQRLFVEFPQGDWRGASLSRYWRKYWMLGLVGLLYNLGLWAEKVLYWFSPAGTSVQGFYHSFPPYDSAILLAYLLTIPASAVFMVNLETNFYQHYRDFYAHILRNDKSDNGRHSEGTFEQITQAKIGMIKAARSGFLTLLKVQGLVAVFALLVAPDLLVLLGLAQQHLTTLRIAVLAASGQVFVLYAMLLLLYVDARRQALMVTAAFAGSNLGLTLLTSIITPRVYGLGYLLSTVLTASLGLYLLSKILPRLDYLTFMLQPLGAPKEPNQLHKRPLPVIGVRRSAK